MQRAIAWLLLGAAVLLLVGFLANARGVAHHRGDEIGSHGTKPPVVLIVP
jgi:hypothetical protein